MRSIFLPLVFCVACNGRRHTFENYPSEANRAEAKGTLRNLLFASTRVLHPRSGGAHQLVAEPMFSKLAQQRRFPVSRMVLAERQEERRLKYIDEYEAEKRQLVTETATFGGLGALVAGLSHSASLGSAVDAAILASLGAAGGLAYFLLLIKRVDTIENRQDSEAKSLEEKLVRARFLPLVMAAVVAVCFEAFQMGSLAMLPREKMESVILGLLTYQVPLLLTSFSFVLAAFTQVLDESDASKGSPIGSLGLIRQLWSQTNREDRTKKPDLKPNNVRGGTSTALDDLSKGFERRNQRVSRELEDMAKSMAKQGVVHRASQSTRLLVLTGTDVAGNSELLATLHQSQFLPTDFPIACTTRPAQPSEVDGIDYIFLDENTFDSMNSAGQLVDVATIGDHKYAIPKTSIQAVMDRNQLCLLSASPESVEQLRNDDQFSPLSHIVRLLDEEKLPSLSDNLVDNKIPAMDAFALPFLKEILSLVKISINGAEKRDTPEERVELTDVSNDDLRRIFR